MQLGFDITRFETPTTKATSERASLIEMFVKRLDGSRTGKYKPLGAGFYASKMSHIKTEDLHAHYDMLDKSNSFCKLWWWYNVPKKK